jgi:putative addiction module killer protein
MVAVVKSGTFDRWLSGLRDARGKAAILVRIERLVVGNAGDVKPVGGGVSAMRIEFGPGYRIYFKRQGEAAILLLAGGDKSTQADDIAKARAIAEEWKDGRDFQPV